MNNIIPKNNNTQDTINWNNTDVNSLDIKTNENSAQIILGNTPSTVPYIEITNGNIISKDGIEEWDVSNDTPNTDPGFLGEVYVWGGQYYAQCGFGYTTLYQFTPVKLYSTKWRKLAGYDHTLGIDENNDLWGWGWNERGQLGLGHTNTTQYTPIKLHTTTKWKNISCSICTSFAQDTNGEWYGWGCNEKGQLGISTDTWQFQKTPIKLSHNTKWKNIFCNISCTFAATDTGELYIWGDSNNTEMGTKRLPYKVSDRTCKKVITTGNTAGNQDTYYLLSEQGELWGWGAGDHGQFGFTMRGDLTTPANLFYGTKWKDIQTNDYTHYALAEDGQWYMWGFGLYYSLGDGSSVAHTQYTPTKCNYVDIKCDKYGTFALAKDGYWYVWGQNGYGNLGVRHDQPIAYPSKQSSTPWKTLFNCRSHTFGMI